jgi:hypothetical protein
LVSVAVLLLAVLAIVAPSAAEFAAVTVTCAGGGMDASAEVGALRREALAEAAPGGATSAGSLDAVTTPSPGADTAEDRRTVLFFERVVFFTSAAAEACGLPDATADTDVAAVVADFRATVVLATVVLATVVFLTATLAGAVG